MQRFPSSWQNVLTKLGFNSKSRRRTAGGRRRSGSYSRRSRLEPLEERRLLALVPVVGQFEVYADAEALPEAVPGDWDGGTGYVEAEAEASGYKPIDDGIGWSYGWSRTVVDVKNEWLPQPGIDPGTGVDIQLNGRTQELLITGTEDVRAWSLGEGRWKAEYLYEESSDLPPDSFEFQVSTSHEFDRIIDFNGEHQDGYNFFAYAKLEVIHLDGTYYRVSVSVYGSVHDHDEAFWGNIDSPDGPSGWFELDSPDFEYELENIPFIPGDKVKLEATYSTGSDGRWGFLSSSNPVPGGPSYIPVDGTSTEWWDGQFNVELVPVRLSAPEVVDVAVWGTGWGALPPFPVGVEAVNGATPVGYSGVDRIEVTFDQAVTQEVLDGIEIDYTGPPVSFERAFKVGDPNTAVIELSRPLDGHRLDFTVGATEFEVIVMPGNYWRDDYVDVLDYCAWGDRCGSTDPLADGVRDGEVDEADYALWKEHFGDVLPEERTPGDYNQDGIVEGLDGVVLRNDLESGSTSLRADGNGNGELDEGDVEVWEANFGQTLPPVDLDGDSNSDGRVDAAEYAAWLDQFSAASVSSLSIVPDMIMVSTLVDENDGNYSFGDLSLREAMSLAWDTPTDDTIVIEPGLTGTIELTSPLLWGNGGDAALGALTIEGPGANSLAIDANGTGSVFTLVYNGGYTDPVTIRGLKLTGAGTGAAAFVKGGGLMSVVTLDQVEISDNVNNAAAISMIGGGEVHVTNSTVANNQTGSSAAIATSSTGLYLTDVTISGNHSTGPVAGLSVGYASATLQNVTVANNRADQDNGLSGAGVHALSGGGITMHNTIVATNLAGTVAADTGRTTGTPAGYFGSGSSYNLVGCDRSGAFPTGSGNQVGNPSNVLDVGLASLGDYSGPTRTHIPLVGSLAIDAGDPSAVAGAGAVPYFDQRGVPYRRVEDGNGDAVRRIDIGAVEVTDTFSPQVVNVTISETDSGYSHDPYSFEDSVGSGEQLRTVPVGGANTITLTFCEDVIVGEGHLALIGLRTGNRPTVADFSFEGNTATWTFDAPFAADQYLIKLSDFATDKSMNWLDGEWHNPASLTTSYNSAYDFPSGNGVAGGDFEFAFNILPADFNRDLSVGFADYSIWLNGPAIPGQATHAEGDANGDGSVGFTDYSMWLNTPSFSPWINTLDVLADLDSDYDVDATDQALYNANPVDFDGDNTAGDDDDDAIMAAFAQFGIDLDVFS